MPNDLVVAHTGNPGSQLRFLCVTTNTLIVTSTLPADAVCVRLRSKNSPIDGFCPPIGQKIPKENYLVYDEQNNILKYYEASSVADCGISYTLKNIQLSTEPTFKYYRALVLYGWSMKNYKFGHGGVTPGRDRSPLAPFRYEVWYFEFDSLDDAYFWRNPKPYTLTPYRKSDLAWLRNANAENFLYRGVGFARAGDIFVLPYITNAHFVTSETIDYEGLVRVGFANHNDGNLGLPTEQYVATFPVYVYEGDFYNDYWYNLNNSNFWEIPLWPLIRRDADLNGIGEEQINVVNSTSNIYIVGVESVFPDRYLFQNPRTIREHRWLTDVFGFWAYAYSLTPSLEKLDEQAPLCPGLFGPYPCHMPFGFADITVSFLDRIFVDFTDPDGNEAAINNNCTLLKKTSFGTWTPFPRTLFYNSSFVYRSLDDSWRNTRFDEVRQDKPRVKFPIKFGARGDDGGGLRHSAIKFGVSIIYAVQYGRNRSIVPLPARTFPEICPPPTIPYAQYILNPY